MKYAIIAAGEGSRLAEEGIAVPKPLVKVGGQCLIDRLIRVFLANDAEEIVVVCNDLTPFVDEHLRMIEHDGFEGRKIPLRHIVRTTPSSMHSFYELSQFLNDSPFVLTTVDTIFRDEEFADYIAAFNASLADGSADGMMGVTDYIDDEKPLYVRATPQPPKGEFLDRSETLKECPDSEKSYKNSSPSGGWGGITGFLDADPDGSCTYISGGIYGLTPKAIDTLNRCMAEGKSRMRNFQRGLIEDGLRLKAFPFSKVLDIDHASDIEKAEAFLNKKDILCIFRARRFSPNSVENDRQILEAVAREMKALGNEVRMITEEEVLSLGVLPEADIVYCMARSDEALEIIERSKAHVINAPEGIRICGNRQALTDIMRRLDVPIPPENGDDGIWLKRGIGTAEVAEDTVFCSSEEEIAEAMRRFADRGITDVCRQAHVVGDLVKFYGVANTDFFYHFYPTDFGRSKFGSEEHNGKAHHYPFSAEEMKTAVDRLATSIGVIVYGGDAIVRSDGSFVIIDFNDWPTFSPCREEAGKKITERPLSRPSGTLSP